MPRRNDLHRILIIGSGPIVIGQACEFDYSGTQAAKALKADGYEVVLVNSNPATIMTDPELAARTYVEPLTAPYLEEIIRRERPDALLSTVQMPPGVPVATVSIGKAGATNAGVLAAQILALGDAAIAGRLDAYKRGLAEKVEKAAQELEKTR